MEEVKAGTEVKADTEAKADMATAKATDSTAEAVSDSIIALPIAIGMKYWKKWQRRILVIDR